MLFLLQLRTYLTGGGRDSFELMLMQQSCSGQTACGRQIKQGESTYKCKQCQKSEHSILCINCFDQSKHVGHDGVTVVAAVADGGCCDCGDPDLWDTDGFCNVHNASFINQDNDLLSPLVALGHDHIARCQRLLGIILSLVPTLLILATNDQCTDQLTSILDMLENLSQLTSFKHIICSLMVKQANDTDDTRLGQILTLAHDQDISTPIYKKVYMLIRSLVMDRLCRVDFAICFLAHYDVVLDRLLAGTHDQFEHKSIRMLASQLYLIPSVTKHLVAQDHLANLFDSISNASSKYLIANKAPLTFQSKLSKPDLDGIDRFWATSDILLIMSCAPLFRDMMINSPSMIRPLLQFMSLFHLSCPFITGIINHLDHRSFYIKNLANNFVMFGLLKTLIPATGTIGSAEDKQALTNTIDMLNTASKLIKQSSTDGGVSFNLPIHRCLTRALSIAVLYYSDQHIFSEMASSFLYVPRASELTCSRRLTLLPSQCM
ncbi:hypothetical protein SAMD00019534_006330 [Acytostelium subglobosum LB1]|uniref:hypothetical protein n=1 Tax=Acytostelium subglobosum LB1 TaxID=1410327 RepID=UPI000644D480|nr:hypothetical protein SAMD00019534_006330 [Acytostelium subglobosum LB1]GAM17458.1 hypothetical protein SAMD00019534_006330 [Acytostelium subglobosum LB1]|eukprot:XP_012759520.1 hypothetical protein SAMD00019534_006330 [Acytostelium subglobosum LB1]